MARCAARLQQSARALRYDAGACGKRGGLCWQVLYLPLQLPARRRAPAGRATGTIPKAQGRDDQALRYRDDHRRPLRPGGRLPSSSTATRERRTPVARQNQKQNEKNREAGADAKRKRISPCWSAKGNYCRTARRRGKSSTSARATTTSERTWEMESTPTEPR